MANKCCFFTLVVIGFISFIYFLDQYFVPLSRISYFDEDICNITRVDYPITLPTPENNENWIRCDCGKYCQGWSPIISLYSDFNEDTLIKYSFEEDHKTYTFGSNECPDMENVIDTMIRLNESINKARTYINSSIDCYVNDNYSEIYLYLELDFIETLIPLMILGITLCGCCCMFSIDLFNKRKEKKNTIEKLNEKIKKNDSRRINNSRSINDTTKLNKSEKIVIYHGNIC